MFNTKIGENWISAYYPMFVTKNSISFHIHTMSNYDHFFALLQASRKTSPHKQRDKLAIGDGLPLRRLSLQPFPPKLASFRVRVEFKNRWNTRSSVMNVGVRKAWIWLAMFNGLLAVARFCGVGCSMVCIHFKAPKPSPTIIFSLPTIISIQSINTCPITKWSP